MGFIFSFAMEGYLRSHASRWCVVLEPDGDCCDWWVHWSKELPLPEGWRRLAHAPRDVGCPTFVDLPEAPRLSLLNVLQHDHVTVFVLSSREQRLLALHPVFDHDKNIKAFCDFLDDSMCMLTEGTLLDVRIQARLRQNAEPTVNETSPQARLPYASVLVHANDQKIFSLLDSSGSYAGVRHKLLLRLPQVRYVTVTGSGSLRLTPKDSSKKGHAHQELCELSKAVQQLLDSDLVYPTGAKCVIDAPWNIRVFSLQPRMLLPQPPPPKPEVTPVRSD